jgi:hypothetical protein
VTVAAGLTVDLKLDAPMAGLTNLRYQQARDALGFARDNTEAILAWDKDSTES